jgi:hypothetical protein
VNIDHASQRLLLRQPNRSDAYYQRKKNHFCAYWNTILTEGPFYPGRLRNRRLAQVLWPDEDHVWISD